jgi:dihydrofolate synthase/folylpolyglutamate synthase
LDPLAYLFGLEQIGIKFGLENVEAIVSRLDHPERAFRTVHVAGTNGKGSVTAMVDAALREAGHRTARYTSPHLVDLTERFVIDGRPVSIDVLADAVGHVRGAVEALRAEGRLEVQPTFFEVTTAVAFELFRRAGVECAVIEVGLGGRLDATNVISPDATGITSIAFDHQLYLGPTLRDIAFEKAGIIKAGVPVVVGEPPSVPAEAREVIDDVARRRGAQVIAPGVLDLAERTIGLRGEHQRRNAAVALGLLRTLDDRGIGIPPAAIDAGLANVEWPGRLDLRRLADGREVLLDAAHNPAGATALALFLRSAFPDGKLPLVFGAMRDKDIPGMFAALLPAVAGLVVTRAETPRSADPALLARHARALAPAMPVAVEVSLPKALDAAWQSSSRIVVAGSIFLLGDVMKLLGLH